jgi:E3 ubiquitin-protein ligase HERC3
MGCSLLLQWDELRPPPSDGGTAGSSGAISNGGDGGAAAAGGGMAGAAPTGGAPAGGTAGGTAGAPTGGAGGTALGGAPTGGAGGAALGGASTGGAATAGATGCGDGVRAPTEICEGADLNGQTCKSQGLTAGALACSSNCSFDTTGCRKVTRVFAGTQHNCALFSSGAVKCWGINAAGALGLGDTVSRGKAPGQMGDALPFVDLGTGRRAVALSLAYYSSCALLDDGSVKCWGQNDGGQLGQGDTSNRGDEPGEMGDALLPVDLGRKATAIAAGEDHTCAVLDDGNVKCWGRNANGQLGLGDTLNRGDTSGSMGSALPYVNLGSGRTATAIAAGSYHTCAFLNGADLKCWGSNSHGELGLGDSMSRGGAATNMGNALPAVDLGTDLHARSMTLGDYYTCALLDNPNGVKCWGSNSFGGLGLAETGNVGDAPNEIGNALPWLNLCTPPREIRTGPVSWHTCALLDGGLACWGDNEYGQLGLGDTVSRGRGAGQMGCGLPYVDVGTGLHAIDVAVGTVQTCALLDDASVKCWGDNLAGNLGLGDTVASKGGHPGEMGDYLPPVAL